MNVQRNYHWKEGLCAAAISLCAAGAVSAQTCTLDGRGAFLNANGDVLTIGTCSDFGVGACAGDIDCTDPLKPFCDAGLCRRLTTERCDVDGDCPSGDVCGGGVVSGAGATLFIDFFTFPASTNDWIDVNQDGFSGFLGSPPFVDQLATPYQAGSDLGSHWEFQYRSVGSVRGFEEFVENQTCSTTPIDVPSERGVFNGIEYADLGAISWPGAPDNTSGTPHVPCSIQFSFLDVPGSWAVQVAGTPSWDKAPTTPGYGLNPIPTSTGQSTKLQTLTRSCGMCSGSGDPCTTDRYCPIGTCTANPGILCRTDAVCDAAMLGDTCDGGEFCDLTGAGSVSLNTSTGSPDELTLFDYVAAWVPVAAIANRGTGIENIKFSEMQYLLVAGRMPNGENLVGAARDVGSGTRNAYENSFGVDTSWGNGDNVGPRINADVCSSLGLVPPASVASCSGQTKTQPTNCGGSGIVENATRNWRLAIGHTGLAGPSRAAVDAAGGQYEILNTCKDVPATGQTACNCSVTGYVRPGVDTVLDNCNPCNSYQVAGAGSFVTRGNRTATPHTVAGIENASVANYLNNIFDSIASFEGNVFEGECNTSGECSDNLTDCQSIAECTAGTCSVTVATSCHGDDDCPIGETCVGAATCDLLACDVDAECPGVGDFCKSKLNMPGQLLATEFFLPDGLDCLHVLNEPLKYVSISTNVDLQEFARTNSVINVPPYGSVNPAGQSPRRNTVPGNLYSDGSDDAYIQWNGASYSELPAARNLSQRNRIQGDMNEDTRRDINDAVQLVAAMYGPRAWQTTAVANAGGAIGQQAADNAIPEVLGDFNGDGNLDKEDLRYFADGLALVSLCSNSDIVCTVNVDCPAPQTCTRHRVRLDRKAGAIAIDNAITGLGEDCPWAADPSINLVTPAVSPLTGGEPTFAVPPPVDGMFTTGKTYQSGDFRGDVAGTNPTAGAWPLGWDGLIDAEDIDYCARNIYNEARGSDWTDLDVAAYLDLSCDMDGNTTLDLDDVYELVVNVLGTEFGDLDLDGIVEPAEISAICAICQNDPANSDFTPCAHPLCGAHSAAVTGVNCNDDNSCSWDEGDINGDKYVSILDLTALGCTTGLSGPVAESGVTAKNRALSFVPMNSSVLTAIRVRRVSPGTTPVTYWVSQPVRHCENASQTVAPNPASPPNYGCFASGIGPRTFLKSELVSAPVYLDWVLASDGGLIDIVDSDVVPGGIYRIEQVEAVCADAGFSFGSPKLTVNSSRHGDIVGNCSTVPCTPPNGLVEIVDVVSLLDKFKNLATGARKARADITPCILDGTIQINDVTLALDAFGGDLFSCP